MLANLGILTVVRCIAWLGRVLPGVLLHGELAKDDDVAKQGCCD